MAIEFPVLVACPDDEGSNEPVESVLRIEDSDLKLWYLCDRVKSGIAISRTFRPFRGPWPLQLALTLFFSPRPPTLTITPFVPAEFWLDIRFACNEDGEAVRKAIGWFVGCLGCQRPDKEPVRKLCGKVVAGGRSANLCFGAGDRSWDSLPSSALCWQ